MGSSNWSDDFYRQKNKERADQGKATFGYDADVRSGRAEKKAHETLDIHGKIRESRDSDAHPESTAVAVVFDVTGSMGSVTKVMQTKLPELMKLLVNRKYVKDPQICMAAVGDYEADRVPLQVGQFESGVETDSNQSNEWQRNLRSGALDLVLTRYAIEAAGGIDSLAITHLDRLSKSGTPVCHEHLDKTGTLPIPRLLVNRQATPATQEKMARDVAEHRPQFVTIKVKVLQILLRPPSMWTLSSHLRGQPILIKN